MDEASNCFNRAKVLRLGTCVDGEEETDVEISSNYFRIVGIAFGLSQVLGIYLRVCALTEVPMVVVDKEDLIVKPIFTFIQ